MAHFIISSLHIAIFVLKSDVKHQLTNISSLYITIVPGTDSASPGDKITETVWSFFVDHLFHLDGQDCERFRLLCYSSKRFCYLSNLNST